MVEQIHEDSADVLFVVENQSDISILLWIAHSFSA
jgi:hypothetical protein